MTKKHFIALADSIRLAQPTREKYGDQIVAANDAWNVVIYHMAQELQRQNPYFKRQRWLDYINGKCGPNGGAI